MITWWLSGETDCWFSCKPRNSRALLPESTVVTAKRKCRRIFISKVAIKMKNEQEIALNNLLNPSLPWYEEVLRSLSISFLSIRLSSTAKTWNWESVVAITIAIIPIPVFSNSINPNRIEGNWRCIRRKKKLGFFFGRVDWC